MNTALLMLEQKFNALWFYIYNPWTIYQIGIILVAYAISKKLSSIVEPHLEEWVRTIKGNVDLLRVFAAFLRRLEWVFFIPLAGLAGVVIRQNTWPSRAWIIDVSISLAAAWLIIAVLSRIIRSRFLARSVTLIGWTIAALSITGLLSTAVSGLDSFAFNIGDFRLSALTVIKGVFLLVGLVWFASFSGNFADSRIKQIDDLTPSLQVLLGKFIKISLMIIAVAVALSSIGLDLTALTVFSGAVGVGIGFGLQKVVSNFISGIIILLDKSIKPGDTISLGETFGWIRELRARFVSVVTRDGKEYLIPNEDLITQQVVNWSFSDDLVRIDVPFGVSYDSDPHEVIEIALTAVNDINRVSKRKTPVCWMTEFGDSSINFVLRFWIRDPQNGLTNIRGAVLISLWDQFKLNDISIPFPHREIIMKDPNKVITEKAPVTSKRGLKD